VGDPSIGFGDLPYFLGPFPFCQTHPPSFSLSSATDNRDRRTTPKRLPSYFCGSWSKRASAYYFSSILALSMVEPTDVRSPFCFSCLAERRPIRLPPPFHEISVQCLLARNIECSKPLLPTYERVLFFFFFFRLSPVRPPLFLFLVFNSRHSGLCLLRFFFPIQR